MLRIGGEHGGLSHWTAELSLDGDADLELTRLLEAITAVDPARDCVVWRDDRRSWALVTDRTRRFANALLAMGIGRHGPRDGVKLRQDRVGVMLLNGPEYLEVVLGAHKARAAPFNVNYHYRGQELRSLLAAAQPRVLVYHERFEAMVGELDLPRRVLLVRVRDGSGSPRTGRAQDLEELLSASSPTPPEVVPHPDDIHLLYTGGTTGLPKGVMWPTGELLAGPMKVRGPDGQTYRTVSEAVRAVQQRERSRVLSAAPFMHGAGLLFALSAWCRGDTVVIQDRVDRLDGPDLASTCSREQVRTVILVGPVMARRLLDGVHGLGSRPGALRTVINTGAGIGGELLDRLSEALPEVRFVDTIGASETGPEAARIGSSGRFALTDDSIALSPDGLRQLRPNIPTVGVLARRGHLPAGYLNDPESTAGLFREINGIRYVVTGDRVVIHPDGTFDLLGRPDTVINTGGEKVFADEVETVIRAAPSIQDVAVFGIPDSTWGSMVVAAVESLGVVSQAELNRFCRSRLAPFKVPKLFVQVGEIPRLPNGKLDRKRLALLADRIAEGDLEKGPGGSPA